MRYFFDPKKFYNIVIFEIKYPFTKNIFFFKLLNKVSMDFVRSNFGTAQKTGQKVFN